MTGRNLSEASAAAMQRRSWKPAPALRSVVSHYAIRAVSLGTRQLYHPLSARNDCFLEFYLHDPFRVVDVATGAIHQAPRMVLVGPHARRREDLIHTGTLKVFHIRFTPIGFSSLFQLRAHSIANRAVNAECVLGLTLRSLEDQLASEPSDRWPSIADRYLMRRIISTRIPPGAVLAASIARSLGRAGGSRPVAELATRHGRSVRHIERLFEDHVGLAPKLYSRIARLQTALRISQQSAADWSSLALQAGYFDQSHMSREFRELTGETPAKFSRLSRTVLPSDVAKTLREIETS